MPKKAQMNANYRKNEWLLESNQIDIGGNTETLVFTLDDDTVITKTFYVKETQ